MATRRADKQAARERRLAAEHAEQARRQRTRRLQIAGGLVIAAAAVAVIVVLLTNHRTNTPVTNPRSPAARSIVGQINRLLDGIPEHNTTLGDPHAPVTITEFGDLECPYCAQFALGAQARLIAHDVRTGKVKLTYKSLETATGGAPNANIWPAQQAAAYAAGRQHRAWYYIELFYHEQGAEDSGYATTSYLQGIAKQIPGLDYPRWDTGRFSRTLARQVIDEGSQARQLKINSTPTVIASGPRSRTRPLTSAAITYTQLQAMIKSVS